MIIDTEKIRKMMGDRCEREMAWWKACVPSWLEMDAQQTINKRIEGLYGALDIVEKLAAGLEAQPK